MALSDLTSLIRSLPRSPGVYLFRSPAGDVLYVGKSRSLRDRVASYLRSEDLEPSKRDLISRVHAIEYLLTDTESEALLLESTLIKKHRPPYNVVMRDDKSYSYLCVDYSKKYPDVYRIRQNHIMRRGAPKAGRAMKLFGPFTSGSTARHALWMVKKYFPVCLAPNKKLKRGCFHYAIHRCPGACIDRADPEEYRKIFKDIERLFSGNTQSLEKKLIAEIERFAAKRQFEQAEIRKRILLSLRRLRERQKCAGRQNERADYVSFVSFGKTGCVALLNVRHGLLSDQKYFLADQIQSPVETTSHILERYYAGAADIPTALYTTLAFPTPVLSIDSVITNRACAIPVRRVIKGERLALLRLGERNAQEFLFRHSVSLDDETPIETLCRIMRIPSAPGFRTEIYDISHLQGSNPVGSLVVFCDSEPDPSRYRKFKLTDVGGPNDFAHMEEILTRRFKHSPNSSLIASKDFRDDNSPPQTPIPEQDAGSQSKMRHECQTTRFELHDLWQLPNLIVIDGGKGQLSVARKVLQRYGLTIPVIALAKRKEEIFIPGRSDPLRLSRTNPALKLLQRMRDAAHRFGITFYRKRHRNALLKDA